MIIRYIANMYTSEYKCKIETAISYYLKSWKKLQKWNIFFSKLQDFSHSLLYLGCAIIKCFCGKGYKKSPFSHNFFVHRIQKPCYKDFIRDAVGMERTIVVNFLSKQ